MDWPATVGNWLAGAKVGFGVAGIGKERPGPV